MHINSNSITNFKLICNKKIFTSNNILKYLVYEIFYTFLKIAT